MADIVEAAEELIAGGGTDFNRAIAEALDCLREMGIAAGNGNVVFLSDGQPNSPVSQKTLDTLEAAQVQVCACRIGTGASMPELWKLDGQAMRVTEPGELQAVWYGFGTGESAAARYGERAGLHRPERQCPVGQ